MKHRKVRRHIRGSPLLAVSHAREICLQVEDHSVWEKSAVDFFRLNSLRDPAAQAARIAEQFANQNQLLMSLLDVQMEQRFDGRDVRLLVRAGSAVGAIPLISPTTGRPDYGLVVQPRFAWLGIGPMLAEMGWRISPTLLHLPLLHRSERRIPVWVLSFVILTRLKALLDSLDRRFELVTEKRRAPRGAVRWNQYATRSLPTAALLAVPCNFPDLREDRLLKGAIRYSVERQLRALETQRQHGGFVQKLIEFGQQILRRVEQVPPYLPSATTFAGWLRRPMRNECFMEGLHAIEWTTEERGLGGLSDLAGLSWKMRMDEFFEAWVETVFRVVASRVGAQVKVGRKRETVHPICWDPSYLGSQKSLIPDIWLEQGDVTIIVDAKYKRHWEELQQNSWSMMNEQFREEHRNDLLQVLAYANLARTSRVIVCLAYPCSPEVWDTLDARHRVLHKAELSVGSKALHLWLTAIPMATAIERITAPLTDNLRALQIQ